MATAGVTIVLSVMLMVLAIPALIGVYVYRDANNRGMNAPMWTLISILAPSLIGFIIYLLVRGNYSDFQCEKCGNKIKDYYVVCPRCGAQLRPICPNCATPVEEDWKVCPKCTHPLPETQNNVVTPTKSKDNVLWKIMILIIVIPILLIIFTIGIFHVQGQSQGLGSVGIPVEEYVEEANDARIENWLKECKKGSERAYVLRYETESKASEEDMVRYLIYMPELEGYYDFIPQMQDGLFKTTLDVHFENVDETEEEYVVLLSYTGRTNVKLKLNLNGEKIKYVMEDVDYPIALSDFLE